MTYQSRRVLRPPTVPQGPREPEPAPGLPLADDANAIKEEAAGVASEPLPLDAAKTVTVPVPPSPRGFRPAIQANQDPSPDLHGDDAGGTEDKKAVETTPVAEKPVTVVVEASAWTAAKITPPSTWRQGWAMAACPRCHHQPTSMVLHESGTFWCAHCGHHGDVRLRAIRGGPQPLARVSSLWERGKPVDEVAHSAERLAQVGLEVEDLSRLDARWAHVLMPDQGWVPALMLPCRDETGQIVDVAAIPYDANGWGSPQRMPGGAPRPWGWSTQFSQVVWTSHVFDAIALRKAGIHEAVALPDGLHPDLPQHSAWGFFPLIEADVTELRKLTLALRNDSAGHALEEELARRWGRERSFRVRWEGVQPSHGGFAAAWRMAHGDAATAQRLVDAQPFPVIGIHELDDVDEAFEALYALGLQPGVSTGMPSLDQFYTVKTGQWTVITGIPGHGKSNILDQILVNLARDQGWVFGIFSPENQPIERHYANLMEKRLRKPFSEGPTARITASEKDSLKPWLNRHFKVLLPDDEAGNWSLEGVLALAKVLVYRHGIRGLVIDPWNELDHSRDNQTTETEYISRALTKIRRFARLHDVHVWVVAHPTKLEPQADGKYPVPTPYMISGGAHWRNKADNAISVFRNVGDVDDDITDVHVQKVRFKEVGRVGVASVRCERVHGAYVDDIDQGLRARALAQKKPLPSSEVRRNSPTSMPAPPLNYSPDYDNQIANAMGFSDDGMFPGSHGHQPVSSSGVGAVNLGLPGLPGEADPFEQQFRELGATPPSDADAPAPPA
jgi:twinkle protein